MTNRFGFSLIEMSVALLLVGMLTASAAPSLHQVADYNDVLAAKRTVATHFDSAQSTAGRLGREVSVNIFGDSIWLAVAGAAGDSAITGKRSLAAMGVDATADLHKVTYDARGRAANVPAGGVTIRLYGLTVADSICVTRSGAPAKRCTA